MDCWNVTDGIYKSVSMLISRKGNWACYFETYCTYLLDFDRPKAEYLLKRNISDVLGYLAILPSRLLCFQGSGDDSRIDFDCPFESHVALHCPRTPTTSSQIHANRSYQTEDIDST